MIPYRGRGILQNIENIKNMKCENKKSKKCSCKKSLNHLNRIEGQIKTLKKYLEQGRKCEDVAMLTTSVAKSFDTLRTTTLKNFLRNEVFVNQKVSKKMEETIDNVLKLYKK